jgi:uncharacterized protein YdeI (YjbR/CyaY-like superfamily)
MPAKPVAFDTPAALRAWFRRHGAKEPELLARIFKVHAAARGVTNSQAVDEALCVGWIDGIRRALDDDSFSVRFTPRRARSIWSAVNIRRFAELEAAGRVTAAGRAAFAARTDDRSRIYSFEQRKDLTLPPAFDRTLRASKPAAAFWDARPPWYRRTCAHWILSAKQETTRERRFAQLIDCCARGVAIRGLEDRIGGKQAKPKS